MPATLKPSQASKPFSPMGFHPRSKLSKSSGRNSCSMQLLACKPACCCYPPRPATLEATRKTHRPSRRRRNCRRKDPVKKISKSNKSTRNRSSGWQQGISCACPPQLSQKLPIGWQKLWRWSLQPSKQIHLQFAIWKAIQFQPHGMEQLTFKIEAKQTGSSEGLNFLLWILWVHGWHCFLQQANVIRKVGLAEFDPKQTKSNNMKWWIWWYSSRTSLNRRRSRSCCLASRNLRSFDPINGPAIARICPKRSHAKAVCTQGRPRFMMVTGMEPPSYQR